MHGFIGKDSTMHNLPNYFI